MSPKLLTLNRRFKTEYEDKVKRNQIFVLIDNDGTAPEYSLEIDLRGILKVEIALYFYCAHRSSDCSGSCGMYADIQCQLRRMKSLLAGVKHGCYVNIGIYPRYFKMPIAESAHDAKKMTKKMDRLTTLPSIERVDIHANWAYPEVDTYEEKSAPVATWTISNGWRY